MNVVMKLLLVVRELKYLKNKISIIGIINYFVPSKLQIYIDNLTHALEQEK